MRGKAVSWNKKRIPAKSNSKTRLSVPMSRFYEPQRAQYYFS
jgi:hypothetical protein